MNDREVVEAFVAYLESWTVTNGQVGKGNA
jgi:hypothetical protein